MKETVNLNKSMDLDEEENKLNAQKENKIPKAKTTSLLGMILSSIWIIVWSSLKFSNVLPVEIPIQDILYSGVTIGAIFAPITISIILDKIKDIKFGG